MKGLFPEFETTSDRDYSATWKQALFVFDTNALLNLYRYQSATRDELLKVLEQLSARIWVPHHVALEFQRNRLKVIAEQSKRFTDVRRAIEKAQSSLLADLEKLQLHRRHSLINPQPLTTGFEKLVSEFLADLSRLQETQQKLSAPDPLKAKIEALFDGRVGKPPKDQNEVDELYREAETRFRIRIPPGYQDVDKDKDGPDEYVHGGIIYRRKYGDFLVWKQLLSDASSSSSKSVILVTDDGKDDWWWKIDSDGPKTIGPRPELIEEARVRAGIEVLLMYNPEGFLKYAKKFLAAPVSEETLKEVRDVSTTRLLRYVRPFELHEMAYQAERAVWHWLEGRFDKVQANRIGFPDFVAERAGKKFGFEVKVVREPRMVMHRLRESVYRAYYEINEGRFNELTIVCIVGSLSDVEALKDALFRTIREQMPDTLHMIIGVTRDQESGEGGFFPIEEFSYGDANFPFRERGREQKIKEEEGEQAQGGTGVQKQLPPYSA